MAQGKPVFTINAMVKVGPWTVARVEDLDEPEHCERCGAEITQAWVCTVEADFDGLVKLNGKREWRIGSTCGPTLATVSAEHWKGATKDLHSNIRLMRDILRLEAAARAQGHALPSEIAERTALLLAGCLDGRPRKRLRFVVTKLSQHLGIRK
jgi:hypothetical protein